jgi:hypothetical protein
MLQGDVISAPPWRKPSPIPLPGHGKTTTRNPLRSRISDMLMIASGNRYMGGRTVLEYKTSVATRYRILVKMNMIKQRRNNSIAIMNNLLG